MATTGSPPYSGTAPSKGLTWVRRDEDGSEVYATPEGDHVYRDPETGEYKPVGPPRPPGGKILAEDGSSVNPDFYSKTSPSYDAAHGSTPSPAGSVAPRPGASQSVASPAPTGGGGSFTGMPRSATSQAVHNWMSGPMDYASHPQARPRPTYEDAPAPPGQGMPGFAPAPNQGPSTPQVQGAQPLPLPPELQANGRPPVPRPGMAPPLPGAGRPYIPMPQRRPMGY